MVSLTGLAPAPPCGRSPAIWKLPAVPMPVMTPGAVHPGPPAVTPAWTMHPFPRTPPQNWRLWPAAAPPGNPCSISQGSGTFWTLPSRWGRESCVPGPTPRLSARRPSTCCAGGAAPPHGGGPLCRYRLPGFGHQALCAGGAGRLCGKKPRGLCLSGKKRRVRPEGPGPGGGSRAGRRGGLAGGTAGGQPGPHRLQPALPDRGGDGSPPAETAREPAMALDGGADGLDFYRLLARAALPRVRPGGCWSLRSAGSSRKRWRPLPGRPAGRRSTAARITAAIPGQCICAVPGQIESGFLLN